MIYFEKAQIGYDKKLFSADFKFEITDTTVLLGANGSGKTSLLKTLIELVPVYSGRINCSFDSVKEISFVWSNPLAVPFLKVDEFILMGLSHEVSWMGTHPQAHLDRLKELSDLLNINKLLSSYVHHLSDGQRKIISIAQALMKKPKLLLLDEPFAFLDPPAKLLLIRYLELIKQRESLKIILSSHDWDLIKNHYSSFLCIFSSQELKYQTKDQLLSDKSNLLREIFNFSDLIEVSDGQFKLKDRLHKASL